MNGPDFIPLIVQLKDLIFLSDCFANAENEEAELLVAELDGISERLESGDASWKPMRGPCSFAGMKTLTHRSA